MSTSPVIRLIRVMWSLMGEEELAPTPPGRPRRERSLALSQGSEAVWAEPSVGPGHGSPQKAVKCLRVWGAEEPRRAESGAATVQKAPFFSEAGEFERRLCGNT